MKTSEKQIVSAVADRFHTYIGRGVRIEPFLDGFEPELNIDDLDRLLRIHFILTTDTEATPGVIDFLERLPERIRHLKTTTDRRLVERQGEVRGPIDWKRTTERRARAGMGAGSGMQFVCRETDVHYGVDENKILKKLLQVIHSIVFKDLEKAMSAPEDYGWLHPWTDSEEPFASRFDRLYKENIYLDRVTDSPTVTDRMLRSVARSREPLYAEAAQLLSSYRELLSLDLETPAVADFLQDVFVRPAETDRLFELYWVFRLLECYEDATLQLIDGEENEIAAWQTDSGSRYRLYHDSTGSSLLEFSERLDEASMPHEDGFLKRSLQVAHQWRPSASTLLGASGGNTLWGGRPDILIERYDEDSDMPSRIFIGEVKYTRDTAYAAQGLRELLEYMAYVQVDGDYLECSDELFEGTQVRGGLFLDEHEKTPTADGAITVAGFGDTVTRPI